MTLARAFSVALTGVEGRIVEVQADVADGLPCVTLVGLPDAAVAESRDRIRAAIVNSQQPWPNKRITLALLPAHIHKRGSGFDLALAIAILCATGRLPAESLAQLVLLGELGLDGSIRGIRGVLPAAIAARQADIPKLVVPPANAAEAALVPGVDVSAFQNLADLIAHLQGEYAQGVAGPVDAPAVNAPSGPTEDLSDVVGQTVGRRGLEIAAAGGHNLFFIGPPGAGKTMLAARLPSILPELSDAHALEVTAIHSVAGLLSPNSGLLRRPPYQDPHHNATTPALIGGGTGVPKPGMVSLAHRGVLFLDEAPEFKTGVLDSLRQPLERGTVTVARAAATVNYPARFQLVMAANPCPCSAPNTGASCVCESRLRRRYFSRLSGPLMDRVDLQLTLLPVSRADLFGDTTLAESSSAVAGRVLQARRCAAHRWGKQGWLLNAEVPGRQLRSRQWRLPNPVTTSVERALERGHISARGFDRVLRVAWTVADLAGRSRPDSGDVAEALGMRVRVSADASSR